MDYSLTISLWVVLLLTLGWLMKNVFRFKVGFIKMALIITAGFFVAPMLEGTILSWGIKFLVWTTVIMYAIKSLFGSKVFIFISTFVLGWVLMGRFGGVFDQKLHQMKKRYVKL
ncbi:MULTISPECIES: hypothetical protein [Bacillus]|uniref:hypothetical protein n=1 Tax=Bacillus TaxID=1386 RepID=UPI00073BADBA|nr:MULTISPECIES: hypothetical protein [Bacillus]KTF59093.1 hypothetical protein AR691_17575 [Bacillus amyloliquefaciens]MCB4337718.1 hypothetical protein [Bacillus subtilis]MCH4866699.1 hypothetical protein [Bacillus sp. 1006-3]QTG87406.1 hypothetical protein J4048_21005 [Bacillus amyloliquefaciens]